MKAKTYFITTLVTEELLGSRYARLTEPFIYYSELLDREILIPVGFTCDYESVPLLKGSSKRGGVIHDYFCRKDSRPVVTKQKAADLYLEAQKARDELLLGGGFMKFWRALARNFKTAVVRVAPGYFHKLSVDAKSEQL